MPEEDRLRRKLNNKSSREIEMSAKALSSIAILLAMLVIVFQVNINRQQHAIIARQSDIQKQLQITNGSSRPIIVAVAVDYDAIASSVRGESAVKECPAGFRCFTIAPDGGISIPMD